MKNGIGTGLYLAGLAGSFIVAWFAGNAISEVYQKGLSSSSGVVAPEKQSPKIIAPLEDISGWPNSYLNSTLKEALQSVSSLAEKTSSDDPHYLRQLQALVRTIPWKEFAQTIDVLRESKSRGAYQLGEELLAWWMEHEFRAAKAYYLTLPPDERNVMIAAVSDTWARMDHEDLLTWFKGLAKPEQAAVASNVYSAIAEALSEREPASAFTLLSEVAGAGNLSENNVIEKIVSEWARRNPQEAAANVLELPAGRTRDMGLACLMAEWTRADPGAVKEWVAKIENPDLARKAAVQYSIQLADLDPGASLAYIIDQGLSLEGNSPIVNAVNKWVVKDPEAALRWAQALPQTIDRNLILGMMLDAYGSQNPRRAAEVFLKEVGHINDGRFAPALASVVYGMVNSGKTDQALAFIRGLPVPYFESVAGTTVPHMLGRIGLQAVFDLGLQLPEGDARQQWLKATFTTAARRNTLTQATQMLERISQGSERDMLAATVVQNGLRSAPEEAAALARQIPNGREIIFASLSEWLNSRQFNEARSWVIATDFFSPEEKQEILTPKRSVSPGAAQGQSTPLPRP